MVVVQVGVLGKHPGYGDFLRHGLSEDIADALTAWIDPTLHEVRSHTGAGWEAFWDNAQDLRFWIGRTVFGRTLCGVLRASHDKVGRRYPLILLAEEPDLLSPILDPDQSFYDALSDHMEKMQPGQGARALLEGLADAGLPEPGMDAETAASQGPMVWAHHPQADLGALLASAVPVDHERAATTRSYWWSTGGGGKAAVWAGLPGMPQPQTMAWLLAGLTGQAAPPEEIDPEPKELDPEPEDAEISDTQEATLPPAAADQKQEPDPISASGD